jgi:hypothetical protein
LSVFLNTIQNIEISMQEKHLKILGVVIIFIGLAILLFTFYEAYSYLKSPIPALDSPQVSSTGTLGQPDINKAMAQAFSPFFNSILPLIYSSAYMSVMGLIGFWILGRGIQLVK